MLMFFLLSFLTVGNLFIYSDSVSLVNTVTNSNDQKNTDDSDKRPINTEEEKSSSSKSVSSNLTEEYIHDHDFFLHLYISSANTLNGHAYMHGLGDDYSLLHCPPPDCILS